MENIKVESGIPIPQAGRGRGGKYPFKKLAIGDSFAMSGDEVAHKRLRCAAALHAKRFGIRLTVRKTGPSEYRCWRIE